MNKYFRIQTLIIGLLISQFNFAQDNYELLYIKGDYDSLLNISQKLSSPEDYYWQSLILDKQGNTLNAIHFLDDGINKYPENHALELLMIDCLYKTGQYSRVKPTLFKYPDKPDIFLKLINILGFEEDYLTAIHYLNDKIRTDSLNIELLSKLGDYYQQADSIDAAINVFETIISINPNDQRNGIRLAGLYLKNKDYINSIEICDLFLQNDSLNKKLIKIKGIAGFNKEDFEMAANCFGLLYEQGDSGLFVLKHLGISEFKNELFAESLEHLLMAFKIDSTNLEITYFLGKAYTNSPTPEISLFYFNRVDSLLQPDPKILSTLYIDKQAVHASMGNFEEAVKCYEMAYKYNSRPEYLFFIASLYHNSIKNKIKALECYENFLLQLPPKPEPDKKTDKKTMTASLRSAAEYNIALLKEELFFEGQLINK